MGAQHPNGWGWARDETPPGSPSTAGSREGYFLPVYKKIYKIHFYQPLSTPPIPTHAHTPWGWCLRSPGLKSQPLGHSSQRGRLLRAAMRPRPGSAASSRPGRRAGQQPGSNAGGSYSAELTGSSSHGESPRVDTAAVTPQAPPLTAACTGLPHEKQSQGSAILPFCDAPMQGATPPDRASPHGAGPRSAPSAGHVGDAWGQGEGTGTAWDLVGCGRSSLRCQQGSAASKAVSKAGRKTTSVPPAALRLSFPRKILIEIF